MLLITTGSCKLDLAVYIITIDILGACALLLADIDQSYHGFFEVNLSDLLTCLKIINSAFVEVIESSGDFKRPVTQRSSISSDGFDVPKGYYFDKGRHAHMGEPRFSKMFTESELIHI